MEDMSTTNREFWRFQYTAGELAKGAIQQRDHRLARIEAWTAAKAQVMKEIRDSGIEISESMAEQMSNYTVGTQSMGPRISIRPDLQHKLSECHQKIERHRLQASMYDAWAQVLQAHLDRNLEVTHEDWLYFFGKL